MTYKLNPEIAKIASPVQIVWNGEEGNHVDRLLNCGDRKEWFFSSGREACEAVFDKHFNTMEYRAIDNHINILVYHFIEPTV